jgi:hypothetical protein
MAAQKNQTLEHYMAMFVEHCERCQQKLAVHAFRQKTREKRQAVYAHCETRDCAKRNQEICFLNV